MGLFPSIPIAFSCTTGLAKLYLKCTLALPNYLVLNYGNSNLCNGNYSGSLAFENIFGDKASQKCTTVSDLVAKQFSWKPSCTSYGIILIFFFFFLSFFLLNFRFLFLFQVVGLSTNLKFLMDLAAHPSFQAADVHTDFIDVSFSQFKFLCRYWRIRLAIARERLLTRL